MNCKICFYHTKIYQHTQFPHRYHYCPTCEGIFLEESFCVDEHREKKQYDQHHNCLENKGYVQMFEDFLDFFWEDITCKEPKVLDFGSGPTPVLKSLLQKRNAHVICYDKFYHPDDAFKLHHYDLITSTEVFEHLNNPLQTLTLLATLLPSGGYIALMTLFHDNSFDNFWKWWYRRDPTHITFYTPKTIEVLAHQCGLESVKHDGKRVVLLKKR